MSRTIKDMDWTDDCNNVRENDIKKIKEIEKKVNERLMKKVNTCDSLSVEEVMRVVCEEAGLPYYHDDRFGWLGEDHEPLRIYFNKEK